MDIVGLIKKCGCWSSVEDDHSDSDRYFVRVHFNDRADAQAFAVELMMVASGQEPYAERIAPRKS